METRREVYQLLGDLLEYPGPDLPGKARRCRDLLLAVQPGAAEPLTGFASFVDSAQPGRWEEVYTSTFDLNPVCCPYVGHQLLGDDPKRAALMVKLQESYRAAEFSIGNELPDHVAVLLKFLARQSDPELERDLMEDLLAPALEKMAASLKGENPYGGVVRSAKCVVQKCMSA